MNERLSGSKCRVLSTIKYFLSSFFLSTLSVIRLFSTKGSFLGCHYSQMGSNTSLVIHYIWSSSHTEKQSKFFLD